MKLIHQPPNVWEQTVGEGTRTNKQTGNERKEAYIDKGDEQDNHSKYLQNITNRN